MWPNQGALFDTECNTSKEDDDDDENKLKSHSWMVLGKEVMQQFSIYFWPEPPEFSPPLSLLILLNCCVIHPRAQKLCSMQLLIMKIDLQN